MCTCISLTGHSQSGIDYTVPDCAVLSMLFLLMQVCGLRPGEFIHAMGDAHVYANHVEPLKEQLQNSLRAFPVSCPAQWMLLKIGPFQWFRHTH